MLRILCFFVALIAVAACLAQLSHQHQNTREQKVLKYMRTVYGNQQFNSEKDSPIQDKERSDPAFEGHEAATKFVSARKGDTAKGVVLAEEKDELLLDMTPCTGESVMTFQQPYSKFQVGTKECSSNRVVPVYQVEQGGR